MHKLTRHHVDDLEVKAQAGASAYHHSNVTDDSIIIIFYPRCSVSEGA